MLKRLEKGEWKEEGESYVAETRMWNLASLLANLRLTPKKRRHNRYEISKKT